MYNAKGLRDQRVITFLVAGDIEYAANQPHTFVALSTKDASDLLRWLSYDANDFGCLDIPELRARCMRRLWPEPRNIDPAIPERREVGANGVSFVVVGRAAGFLRERTRDLLKLIDRAQHLKQEFGIDHDCIIYS